MNNLFIRGKLCVGGAVIYNPCKNEGGRGIMAGKHRIQYEINDEMWKKLQKRCRSQGRTASNLAQYRLMLYLDKPYPGPRDKNKKPPYDIKLKPYDERVEQMLEATKEFKRMKVKNKGFVYFVTADINGKKYCKIGRTLNLTRLDAYPIKVPFETKLFIAFEVENHDKIETLFHKRYASMRREGEWFELLKSDYNDIERRGLSLIGKTKSLIRTVKGVNNAKQ